MNFTDEVMMSKMKRKSINVVNKRKDFFITLILELTVT